MAVVQVEAIVVDGEIKLNNIVEHTNDNTYAHDRVTLTEWDTTTVPQVAAGGLFEAGGAYYEVQSDTTISGTPTNAVWNFIKFTPSTKVFAWTTTAPTWDNEKLGYYSGTDKYMPFAVSLFSGTYIKVIHDFENRIKSDPIRMLVADTGLKSLTNTSGNFVKITNWSSGASFDVYDQCFNFTTGIFTPPTNGIYTITFVPSLYNGTGSPLVGEFAISSGTTSAIYDYTSLSVSATSGKIGKILNATLRLNTANTIAISYIATSTSLQLQSGSPGYGGATAQPYLRIFRIA